jgi:hypothetical protein
MEVFRALRNRGIIAYGHPGTSTCSPSLLGAKCATDLPTYDSFEKPNTKSAFGALDQVQRFIVTARPLGQCRQAANPQTQLGARLRSSPTRMLCYLTCELHDETQRGRPRYSLASQTPSSHGHAGDEGPEHWPPCLLETLSTIAETWIYTWD